MVAQPRGEALEGNYGGLGCEALKGRWLQGNWDLGGLQHTVLLHHALHLYLHYTHTALSPGRRSTELSPTSVEASTEHALTLTSLPRSRVQTLLINGLAQKWTFEKCNFYLHMFQTVSCHD